MNDFQKATAQAEDALRSAEKRCSTLEQDVSEATRVVEGIEAEVDKFARAASAAEDAYADAPTEDTEAPLRLAREAHDLAELRARKPLAAAQAKREAAEQALSDYRPEVDAAKDAFEAARSAECIAERLAACSERASVASFRARTVDAYQRIFAARDAILTAVAEIDTIFDETNAAAGELRKADANIPDLAAFHLLVPFVLRLAKENPEANAEYLRDNYAKLGVACYSDELSGSKRSLKFGINAIDQLIRACASKPVRDSETAAKLLAQLEAALECRTQLEAEAARHAKKLEQEPPPIIAPDADVAVNGYDPAGVVDQIGMPRARGYLDRLDA